MEKTYLTDYIQNVLEEVTLHNEPFDDTKKKWIRQYGAMDKLTTDESDLIIKKLEILFETLAELKVMDSKYLELNAKELGSDMGLSKIMVDGLLDSLRRSREENDAKMQEEIQMNLAATMEANKECKSETDSLKILKSQILEVESATEDVLQNAKRKALENTRQRSDKENNDYQTLVNQSQRKKQRIADLELEDKKMLKEIQELQGKVNEIKLKRERVIHNILLVSFAFLLSFLDFLTFEERGLAWVPCILSLIFVAIRLGALYDFGKNGRNSPEVLFSLVPLAFIHIEAAFIDSNCWHVWWLTFFILIPTLCLFVAYESGLSFTCSKEEAIHLFLLGASALLVSLAEFFTFGNKVFNLPYECYGWGWAFVSLLFNFGWVLLVFELLEKEESIPLSYQYFFSFGTLLIANAVAYCTRNGWVILMFLVYGVFYFLGDTIFDNMRKTKQQ